VGIGGALLAAASLGFAGYNLPLARMFMGDVGSTFLGFSFAGLTLLGNIGVGGIRLPIEFGLVLFAPFVFDGLVTLSRRVVRGERWYAAHRSHYYQRLVSRGLSHGQVTSLYAGLAVIAAGAALAGLYAPQPLREVLAVLAYLPMLAVVALVHRLEGPQQPNQGPTVVTQG
jgi:UDP-N-acetylmuramyl pentapeptide phosphotransferase/UDP-N-acetylglucosamine-1-phosphate transferase